VSPARTTLRVALALGFLVGAAACGSDDSSGSQSTSSPTVAASANTSGSADTSGSGDGGIVEQVGGEGADDIVSGLSIEAKASTLASALDSDRDPEIIDDSTAKIFLDGDVEVDGVMACIVVGAIIDPDETVIVVYPNGETNCA